MIPECGRKKAKNQTKEKGRKAIAYSSSASKEVKRALCRTRRPDQILRVSVKLYAGQVIQVRA